MKILIIGGDLRFAAIADSLAKKRFDATTCLLEKAELSVPKVPLTEALKENDIIILGLPCSRDDYTLNAPFSDTKLSLVELFSAIKPGTLILAGVVSEKIAELARHYNVTIIDYFKREELEILNSIPTSEGAIEIAMAELPITIHSCKCLVLGYGRIGKFLCSQLKGLGANVTATSRSHEGMAWINAACLNGVYTDKIAGYLGDFDLIFNTIPQKILREQELRLLKPDCLVIDLASKPGGVDFVAAKDLGIKVIWALSLPGKCAPVTAGEIICSTVLNILSEAEV